MLIIGTILAFVALAYLCWLLFALAVYALPFFAGLSAGLAAYHSGSGPIGAIIVGAVTGAVTLLLGQVALATVRSPLIRGTIALLFASAGSAGGLSRRAWPCTRRDTRRGMARCNGSCRRHYRGVDGLATHDPLFLKRIGLWRCHRSDVVWPAIVADSGVHSLARRRQNVRSCGEADEA
jgi:hypothetical protein